MEKLSIATGSLSSEFHKTDLKRTETLLMQGLCVMQAGASYGLT